MSLGENIYHLRTEKNMSQGDLADALNVPRQSVSKWENNSATPELEKLIRMCELFGVSLDELAGRKADPQPIPEQTENPSAETKVIYIEKPVFPKISRHHLIGCIILFCSFLYAIILYNGRFDGTQTLFMVAPVAVCGILYLTTKHPLFFSGWMCAGGYWGHFFILFPRWEHHPVLILLGVALVAVMVIWAVRIHRKGILHIPAWVWSVGGFLLAGLFILLCMNCVPPFWIESSSSTVLPSGT